LLVTVTIEYRQDSTNELVIYIDFNFFEHLSEFIYVNKAVLINFESVEELV